MWLPWGRAATRGRPYTNSQVVECTNVMWSDLAAIPVAPEVAAHSIIAVKGDDPVEAGTDGVVKYESAHIEGVESELVVNSGHSAQSNPRTVEAVRRILLLQATEVCTETRVACKKPFRENDENTGADTRAQAQ